MILIGGLRQDGVRAQIIFLGTQRAPKRRAKSGSNFEVLFACFWDHFGKLFGLALEEFLGFGAQVGVPWFFMDFGTLSGALPNSTS